MSPKVAIPYPINVIIDKKTITNLSPIISLTPLITYRSTSRNYWSY